MLKKRRLLLHFLLIKHWWRSLSVWDEKSLFLFVFKSINYCWKLFVQCMMSRCCMFRHQAKCWQKDDWWCMRIKQKSTNCCLQAMQHSTVMERKGKCKINFNRLPETAELPTYPKSQKWSHLEAYLAMLMSYRFPLVVPSLCENTNEADKICAQLDCVLSFKWNVKKSVNQKINTLEHQQ